MTHTQKSTILLRALWSLLILLNLLAIAYFSAQNGAQSQQTSGRVTHAVARTVIKDFAQKPVAEQEAIVGRLHAPLRNLAHVTEYACLGAWILLLLVTWKERLKLRYVLSLGLVLLVAVLDECHQYFVDARGAQITDVLLDMSGALLTCTAILLVTAWYRHRKRTKKEAYTDVTNHTL